MAIPVEVQLKNNFPLRPLEELNASKAKININFLTEKSERRSNIVTTAREDFELAEKTYTEFVTLLQDNRFKIYRNSEIDYSMYIGSPSDSEIENYLAPVLYEFKSRNYYIKNELQAIFNNLQCAYSELKHQSFAYTKGERGEEYVRAETAILSSKYQTLYNIRIPSDVSQSNSSELDIVFSTPKGLVIGEIKTFGSAESDKFIVSQDGMWTRLHNGYEETLSNSPTRQNMIHSLAVENFFASHGIQMKVIPIILWASDAKIENHSCTTIIRPELLYDFIEQCPLPEKYDAQCQDKIITLLKENDLGDNIFTIKTFNHNTDIIETTKELLQFMNDNFNAAIKACNYHPQYPFSRKLKKFLKIVIPILAVIMFYKLFPLVFGAILMALGYLIGILVVGDVILSKMGGNG